MNEQLWQQERIKHLERQLQILQTEIKDLEEAQAQAIAKVIKITARLSEARARWRVNKTENGHRP